MARMRSTLSMRISRRHIPLSSLMIYRWHSEEAGKLTEMVVSQAKLEEQFSGFLDFQTAFPEFFRALYVTYPIFSGTFLHPTNSFRFCWVRYVRVRGYRSGPSCFQGYYGDLMRACAYFWKISIGNS